jgi:hypothetical protein
VEAVVLQHALHQGVRLLNGAHHDAWRLEGCMTQGRGGACTR